ncbi:PhnD/SsuA/transferrin family substrate-binding protein [Rhodoferax ferrireducens]|uniref:PhnD/SsuA/transferrin family substrate-binding protein n=1 Tax=Rhodoferax ferrireducens TaxID=192843 RepID=UPI00298E972D|nr:PhnD/SsuA/transferrin family substrate-binding protein [Rhodoferax ferrireducens]WPC65883.1 PhnD/SsuA/transferrin family substrate-binding protein [Rhodoferax ferrireducens]
MNRRHGIQALLATAVSAITGPVAASAARLRIGLTSVILADQVAFLSRWERYLSSNVGCEVSFVARESYQAILDLLFSGQIDAAWICGYPYIRYESDLSLLAVPLYEGEPVYQAYLIRSRQLDVAIKQWSDLRGKVLAYSDPLSNSGWLVAQVQLALAGVRERDLKRVFFAHGHRNVAEAVAARLAQAGSIDGYVWETMRQQGMAAIAQTEVVWKSERHGFPPLVTLRNTAHPFRPQLQQAVLSMSNDGAGQALLHDLNLTGFTAGSPDLFDSIRRQAQTVPGSGVGA